MESISKREIIDTSRKITKHGMIVFAGAGISTNPPSRVPGWSALNGMILDALKRRVTSYLDQNQIWLDEVIKGLIGRRDGGRFPPAYQAQIMEEQCGESYFRALTAVDVAQRNEAHTAIAALAKFGIMQGMATTNFDRLIERALEAEKVPYETFIDEDGFHRFLKNENAYLNKPPIIPVLKIHGSVESTTSMIDTLQQRMRHRKELLDKLMVKLLGSHFVLYIGFSAADLNHNPDYLGLRRSAENSPGALFVQYPGSKLEPGAKILLESYGSRGYRIEATLDDFFSQLFTEMNLGYLEKPEVIDTNPEMTVRKRLEVWAESLQPYEAINVLTALLDAGGEEENALYVLYRTWKERLPADLEGEHYARYQYNYASHCVQHGQMLYGETPQNFLRSQDIVSQSRAGFALWNLYRGRVDYFWPFLLEAKVNALDLTDLRLEGDLMFVLAQAAVIYRWIDVLNDVIQAGNRQFKAGDIPRAVRLWATAARLAAYSDKPLIAFNLFDHCEGWVNYLGDDASHAELYLAQGIANFEMGSTGSAGFNYEHAVPILRRYHRLPSLIEGLVEGFRYYIAEGLVNEGGPQLIEEASKCIANGYEIYYPHLGIAVAEYHLGVKQWERARRELLKCRPFAEQTNNEWAISTIDAHMKRIEKELGH